MSEAAAATAMDAVNAKLTPAEWVRELDRVVELVKQSRLQLARLEAEVEELAGHLSNAECSRDNERISYIRHREQLEALVRFVAPEVET